MAFRTHLRFRPNDVQSPVHHDSCGNVKNIAVRGTALEFGDGARCDVSSGVALGNGVVNASAASVAIGANSAKLAQLSTTGHSYLAPAVAAAGAAPTGAQVFSGVYNMNAALTWPSAATLVAAFPNAAVGDCCLFTVVNSTAGALAQAAAGGATVLDSSWSIAAHGARTFVIRLTNVTGGAEAYTVA